MELTRNRTRKCEDAMTAEMFICTSGIASRYSLSTNHVVSVVFWSNNVTEVEYWSVGNSSGEYWIEEGYIRVAAGFLLCVCSLRGLCP